ncbi:MAG: alpha/beta fold hydrolase [Pseudomonadota bacterium]|nr:alpha/beta fold hydrolase [Pseudomonadota bacterium]
MKITALQSTPWLVRTPAPGRQMRLFCFSYAGGNAFNFFRWQESLDSSIEVAAVQLPGRGARIAETPIASMSTLLRALAPVLAQRDELPFAFFGHSVGALVAFELTRYLQLHGLSLPRHLFLSGCQAPQFRSPSRQLHLLSDDAFMAVLGHYNGTPPDVLQNTELMQLLLPTIRADFALAEDYRYRSGPLLPLPISVFAGRDDDNKASGQVEGWAKETAEACQVTWFNGGHFFVNSDRDAVLNRLQVELLALRRSPTAANGLGESARRA